MDDIDRMINKANIRLSELSIEDELEELRYASDTRNIDPLKVILKHPKYRNFWDAEYINWDKRLEPIHKTVVRQFLEQNAKGRILNIGSGSENFIKNSMVCIDISVMMLGSNPSKSRINLDINGPLPFRKSSFDTVIASFVLNYIDNLEGVLVEIRRILRDGGKLLCLQCPLNNWYLTQNRHTIKHLIRKLSEVFSISQTKRERITAIIAQ